jgi:hypothetical protein
VLASRPRARAHVPALATAVLGRGSSAEPAHFSPCPAASPVRPARAAPAAPAARASPAGSSAPAGPAIATPEIGGLVDELAPGSPLFFYLPWAPLGVVLAASLTVRLPRLGAPSWVVRRVWWACGAVGVAVAVKVLLITRVNPHFRDPHADVGELREWAVRWAIGNGAAILAVGAALDCSTARLLDDAATLGAAEAT